MRFRIKVLTTLSVANICSYCHQFRHEIEGGSVNYSRIRFNIGSNNVRPVKSRRSRFGDVGATPGSLWNHVSLGCVGMTWDRMRFTLGLFGGSSGGPKSVPKLTEQIHVFRSILGILVFEFLKLVKCLLGVFLSLSC